MSLLLLFFPNRDQTAPNSWPTDFHREDFSASDFSIQRVTGFVIRCLPYQIVYIKLGLVRRCLNVFVNMFIVSYLNMQETDPLLTSPCEVQPKIFADFGEIFIFCFRIILLWIKNAQICMFVWTAENFLEKGLKSVVKKATLKFDWRRPKNCPKITSSKKNPSLISLKNKDFLDLRTSRLNCAANHSWYFVNSLKLWQ